MPVSQKKLALIEQKEKLVSEMEAIVESVEPDQAAFDAKAAEVKAIDAQLARLSQLEQLQGEVAETRAPARSATAAFAGAVRGPEAKKEFENFGQFLEAAAFRRNDQRLESVELDRSAGNNMSVGYTGGFLVPTQFVNDMMSVAGEGALIRPRAIVLPAGDVPDAEVEVPALSQTSTDGVQGGFTLTPISEGGSMTSNTIKFKQIKLKANEAAGYIPITNKLLRNFSAMSAMLSRLFGEAVTSYEELKFLFGNGSGQPSGMLNAANPALISVTRSGSGALTLADVANMQGRALTTNAFFAASPSCVPKLLQLADGGNNNIALNSSQDGLAGRLLGRPLYISRWMNQVGSLGDIALIDPSYYAIKDGVKMAIAFSEHVAFTTNETYVRVVHSVDGQSLLANAITPEKQTDTLSAFVALAA